MIRTAILTLASTTGEEIIARLRMDGLATETGIANIPIADDGWLKTFLRKWLSNGKYLEIEEAEVITFGRNLFRSIFTGNVSRGWDRLLTLNGTDDAIRLLLNVEDPRLLAVPFELMHDGAGFVDPTKAHIFRVLSRPVQEQAGFKPIRRLAVLLAEPEDFQPWGRDEHRTDIEAVFGSLSDPNDEKIAVEFVEPPTLSGLSTMLDGARDEGRFYDALYIVAHGEAPDGQEAKLVFERDNKQGFKVAASTLTERLKVNPGLFITLAACSSSTTTLNDPYSGFAQSLMENAHAGAVLAMQRDALISATLPITETLFRELVAGKLPESAVIRARTSEAEHHKARVPILFTRAHGPETERAQRLGNLLNLDPANFRRLDVVLPSFRMGLLTDEYEKLMRDGRHPRWNDGYHYRNETNARPDLMAAWSVISLFQDAWAGLTIKPKLRFVSPDEFVDAGYGSEEIASHVITVGTRSQDLLPAVFQRSGRFKFNFTDDEQQWTLTDERSGRDYTTAAPQTQDRLPKEDYLLIEKLTHLRQTYIVLAGFTDKGTELAGKRFSECWLDYQKRYGGQPFQRLYKWETALGPNGVYLKDVIERVVPHQGLNEHSA